MKSRNARFAQYLGIFSCLFFVASAQYCQAELITTGKGLAYYKFPLLIIAGLTLVLEMFLLRWLLAVSLPKALTTAFLANLASAVAGPKLSDFSYFIFLHLYVIFQDWVARTLLSLVLLPLLFLLIGLLSIIPLEFPIIWILNRPAGWKRALKASVVVNCLSSPLLFAYLIMLFEAYKSLTFFT
jgi:hypothetical protein